LADSRGVVVGDGTEVVGTAAPRRASFVFMYRPYVDRSRTPPTKKAPAEHTSLHDSRSALRREVT